MPRIDEKAILKELARREQHKTAVAKKRVRKQDGSPDTPSPETDYAFLRDLFKRQRDFIFDSSDHKTLLCSRRAGKSYTAVAYLLKEAMDNPGVVCVYIATTRIHAKRILEKELNNFNHRYNLGAKYNKTELVVTLPNGSSILLTGADDAQDIERLRGGKYALVILDEAASYGPHFETLIEEVLEPALLDLDGTLCLLGTPGIIAAGLFFDATTKGRSANAESVPTANDIAAGDDEPIQERLWSNHGWTVLENEALLRTRDVHKWLADKRKRKGWTIDHPIYRREWCGEWVRSTDDLVYRFDQERNTYTTLPVLAKDKWRYILGIDFGYNDAFTVTCLAFAATHSTVYEVESFKQSKLIPSQMASVVQDFVDRYNPVSCVADAGALGKAIVEELKQRYSLPLKAAEKANKVAYIELFNGDLVAGRLKFTKHAPHLAEMARLQWAEGSNRTKEDPTLPNDSCFVAGTLVRTKRGQVPIEYVTTQDEVLTRHGWQQVTAARCTGRKPVLRLTTEAGHSVIATGNHPFLTTAGWKRLDALRPGDMLYACRENQGCLTAAQDKNTSREPNRIARFGRLLTDRFRRGITFIIKTVTPRTTHSTTLSAFLLQRMACGIGKNTAKKNANTRAEISKKRLLQRFIGTRHRKAERGIRSTLAKWLLKQHSSNAFVLCVEDSLYQRRPLLAFAAWPATQGSAATPGETISHSIVSNAAKRAHVTNTNYLIPTILVAPTRVQRLETIASEQLVYELTVAVAHEYFAGDLLVSNCDSALYAFREAKHWLPDQDGDDIASLRVDYQRDPFERLAAQHPNGRPPQELPWWEHPAHEGGTHAAQRNSDLLTSMGDGNFGESSPVDDDWLH